MCRPRQPSRAAGGAGPGAHRPEVPRTGRRPPRLGPRPAGLSAGHAGAARGAQRAELAPRRAHRPHRGGGAALVPGEVRHLAQRLFPGPRAAGGGEPGAVGAAAVRGGAAAGPHRQRDAAPGRRWATTPGAASPSMWTPTLEAGAPRGRRQDRQGSRHAPAGPALGAAARRRRLPLPGGAAHPRAPAAARTREALDVPVVATPIRILLVTARPEDEACGYIDHRASALPLVEAMEALPGLVAAARAQPAHAARAARRSSTAPGTRTSPITSSTSTATASTTAPWAWAGCASRTRGRRQAGGAPPRTVYTDELGPLLRDHRIPLVFLEACQTAPGRAGLRVGGLRAAEGGRGLGGGHEPQRAGGDRARASSPRFTARWPRASAWATPCWRGSAR